MTTVLGFDPLAGLETRPYRVAVAGHLITVPAATASTWLVAWGEYGAAGVLFGMLDNPTDRYRLTSAVMNGDATGDQVAAASRTLFATAAGTAPRWWLAERLAMYSVSWSGVGGEMLSQGLRPAELPLGAWLACAYRVLVTCTKKEDWPGLEASLVLPPAGYDTQQLPSRMGEFFTP